MKEQIEFLRILQTLENLNPSQEKFPNERWLEREIKSSAFSLRNEDYLLSNELFLIGKRNYLN